MTLRVILEGENCLRETEKTGYVEVKKYLKIEYVRIVKKKGRRFRFSVIFIKVSLKHYILNKLVRVICNESICCSNV